MSALEEYRKATARHRGKANHIIHCADAAIAELEAAFEHANELCIRDLNVTEKRAEQAEAEVARLTAELSGAELQIEAWRDERYAWSDRAEQAEAEVARLKKMVGEAADVMVDLNESIRSVLPTQRVITAEDIIDDLARRYEETKKVTDG